MDALNELLLGWGWLGLFVSAFLAGTVLPFSSEVVLLACIAGGTPPVAGVAAATAGNALGGMTCYWVGRLGRTEWIARYLRVGPRELARARRFMRGRGAWMAVLSFLPVVGDAMLIVLGLMRANPWITAAAMTAGKLGRYAAVAGLISFF